jgi:hypothetical protein
MNKASGEMVDLECANSELREEVETLKVSYVCSICHIPPGMPQKDSVHIGLAISLQRFAVF